MKTITCPKCNGKGTVEVLIMGTDTDIIECDHINHITGENYGK